MARGINKVILIGNLGADPEVRYSPNGIAITTLSLATTEAWRDKQSGEMVEQTEWHRVVCFRRLAEIAGEYLKKGSKIYIEGRLRTRKWQDQQGMDRYTTEITADNLQMLDSRGAGGGNFAPAQQQAAAAAPAAAPAAAGANQSSPAPAPNDFDDDIPF